MLVWRYYQLLSGFLTKGHLPRVSRQSRLSANDKGDDEKIPGAVYRSTDICPTAEENPGKPKLGDRLKRAVRPVIDSNNVCRIAQHARKGEGREEGKAAI